MIFAYKKYSWQKHYFLPLSNQAPSKRGKNSLFFFLLLLNLETRKCYIVKYYTVRGYFIILYKIYSRLLKGVSKYQRYIKYVQQQRKYKKTAKRTQKGGKTLQTLWTVSICTLHDTIRHHSPHCVIRNGWKPISTWSSAI